MPGDSSLSLQSPASATAVPGKVEDTPPDASTSSTSVGVTGDEQEDECWGEDTTKTAYREEQTRECSPREGRVPPVTLSVIHIYRRVEGVICSQPPGKYKIYK